MKHLVIGSGPCGALAAFLLLKAGMSVDIVDTNDNKNIDDSSLKSKLKLMQGESHPYDINQFLAVEVEGEVASFYRSKIRGGFSRIWGATWNSPPVSKDNSWVQNYNKVNQIVSENLKEHSGALGQEVLANSECNCLRFLYDTEPFNDGSLKVSQLAAQISDCGCIATGESICVHGSVWNSTYLIKECEKFQNFNFYSGIDVQSLMLEQNMIAINQPSGSQEYDSVTLAAGPLGNTEILLNSISGTDKILLHETRMAFLPYLRFNLNTGHKGAFAFSQFNLDIRQVNNEVLANVQLYAHSEKYKERIEGKFPKALVPIVSALLRFLTPHMGIALLYLNSDYSESLTFRKSVTARKLIVELNRPKFEHKKFQRRLWNSFRSIGLYPLLPALSWAKPGESYHLGASPNLLDEYGFLKSDKRVSVSGSFALPIILPGPITHSAMAQTSRLVERIIHQNLERI
jgi:hypothetical protein